MSVITEGKNIGDLVRYQLDKDYCRDVVTVLAGENLKIGTVLGVGSDGKYTSAISAAVEEGGNSAVAVLLADCDATNGDTKAVVLKRTAIVVRSGLVFPEGVTSEDKTKFESDLEVRGIVVRDSL